MRLLFFTVLLCVSTLSIAQKQYFAVGYIIKADSTLQAGYVVEQDSLPSNAMYFKDSVNSTPRRYEPNQILGYGFYKGKSYMSFRTSDHVNLFFEKLNEGNVAFYKALSIYLIKEGKEQPVQLPKSRYKEFLSDRFSGCPSAVDAVQKLKLDRRHLRELAEDYNACIASPDPQHFEGLNSLEVRLAVTGALTTTAFTFNASTAYPLLSGASVSNLTPISVGLQTWLRMPERWARITARTGVIFEPHRYDIVSNEPSKLYQVQFSYSAVNIPVAFQYWLGKPDKKKFYLTAGLLFTVVSNFTSSAVEDTPSYTSVYIDESVPFNNFSVDPRITLGAGRCFNLFGKQKIIFDVRYSVGGATGKSDETAASINAKSTSFTMELGYLLK